MIRKDMKTIVTSLLVATTFLSVLMFGFAMADNMQGAVMQSNCVASMVSGNIVDCPTNIAAVAAHHISALQTLTRAMVSPIFTLLLLVALFLTLAFTIARKLLYPMDTALPSRRLEHLTLDSASYQRKKISWLALFELSPSLI